MKTITIGKTAFILLALAGMSGCHPWAGDEKSLGPENKGNGVFHFHRDGKYIAADISSFLGDHPDLEVSAIAGDGQDAYGANDGYIVVFRQKYQTEAK